jgi:chromosome partitioning protein
LEGLSALLDTVEKVRRLLNPRLHVGGLLRTMFDRRNNLSNQVSSQLVKHFGEKVYRTIIPRNVRLAEAPSHGLPALLYDKNSSGAQAYLAFAGEVLRRDGSAQHTQFPSPESTLADEEDVRLPVLSQFVTHEDYRE